MHWLIIWCRQDNIGAILTGLLGFVVSISSQITFPAPWRSYAGATGFTLKQMIGIFLPGWCIGFLPVSAFIAIVTLDWDRKRQVGIVIIKFT